MLVRVLASSSSGNAYTLSDGGVTLLLEAGLRYRDLQRALGFGVTGLAGCLVSHEHADHSKAVREVMRAGVNVYASAGTVRALGLKGHRLRSVKPLQQFDVGPFVVMPFPTVHDAADPLGFVVATENGKVLYLTDSAYSAYKFNGLTHVLVEANYSTRILDRNVETGVIPVEHRNRVLRSHLSLERAIDLLRANDMSQVREIHLLHLSDANSNEEEFKRAVQRAVGRPVYVARAEGDT
jgi:phosphoribosyl 1,2-cyclic phosphodiesterase